MSEEMAVGDKASSDENKVGSEDSLIETTDSLDASEPPEETETPETELEKGSSEPIEDALAPELKEIEQKEENSSIINEMEYEKNENKENEDEVEKEIKEEYVESINDEEEVLQEKEIKVEKDEHKYEEDDIQSKLELIRGIKRRASTAFSDEGVEEFKGFDNFETTALAEYCRIVEEDRRVKRRPSTSSEIEDDGFKGFDLVQHSNLTGYCQVLERLEAEVAASVQSYKPLRSVMAAPPIKPSKRARQETGGCKWSDHLEEEVTAFVKSFSDETTIKAGKRQRQGTDGSRPSSALSSRSDGDGTILTDASLSPVARGGRRTTVEMSSPLLRVPLERGWKRELVYRATITNDNKRNADIYYYTPLGKKLRSTREVAEQLPGTGLTLENFSFFKEPLGLDDPEKEIIRDAKVLRRVESPVPVAPVAPTVDGKRTPKPKPPKGASPEPATPKSPPAKIKVKSMGSRISSNGTTTPKQIKKPAQTQLQLQPQPQQQPQQQPTPADNNNTAAWKKPRGLPPLQPRPPPAAATAPAPPARHDADHHQRQVSRQVQQPCSMTCGRGAVPSLACAACLCLYHPVCVGFVHNTPPERFLCKNCRKSSSPPLDPPPLIHKSGISTHQPQLPNTCSLPAPMSTSMVASASGGRRLPVPAKVPRNDKRVLLRMKVSSGGPDGERVWAVAKPQTTPTPPTNPAPVQPSSASPAPTLISPHATPSTPTSVPVCRPALPQSLAIINGRRFIVVSRALHHDGGKTLRGRLANGASSPPAPAQSPRRRGRPKATDDSDYFTSFYNKAQENNYNIAVQIFQYLGMRELSRCARVCKLWQQLAATPALWRHVRMKNSHVSDWAGLCAALKRHGTRWLDLRKMLLPQNDALFWDHFAQHIGSVDTLERLELCRCPARAVEAACERLPSLRALAAPAIRDARLDPSPLAGLPRLELLRLKSLAGLALTRDLRPLAALSRLQHLSLTSIKELGWCACEVVGQLEQLESLELGECSFGGSFATALGKLIKLRRLRLERGVAHCAAPALLRALAALPKLTRLELVNFDVKVGFDDALAECKNIQRLLIIPTYVSQSATTNKQVLSGVLRLKETLTHLMWGVTIELLRVTELFIDQCEAGEGESKRRDVGECIPVLKPVPGCRLPDDHRTVAGPPQVEILPIPTLQRLLSAQLPNTKLKLLRIPFHATWRQSLADFQ